MTREIAVNTSPAEDGTYVVTLDVDEDHTFRLDDDDVANYAHDVMRAVAVAEYDAAVVRQLTTVFQKKRQPAMLVVQAMREARGPMPVPIRPIPSFVLTPGVSAFTGKPFLVVEFGGERLGQWEPDDARSHVLGVLEANAVLPLDHQYFQVLTGRLGMDAGTAQRVVGSLSEYRVPSVGEDG